MTGNTKTIAEAIHRGMTASGESCDIVRLQEAYMKDLSKYDKIEKYLLLFGVIFAFIGILGAAIISESYGYNRTFTDIYGNKRIENSKQ